MNKSIKFIWDKTKPLLPDKLFLQLNYYFCFKHFINFKKPATFNEKLQWLKLYDRNPLYPTIVDKETVKKYIEDKIGIEHIIPTLGIWDTVEDIDFSCLPNKFVIKATHDSGSVIVCTDKQKLDLDSVKEKLRKCLATDYYLKAREWPYKKVKPKIIAEQYIGESNKSLIDYKFFCFNGYVDNVMICLERESGDPKFYFFNEQWELLRINKRGKEAPLNFTLPKPKCMDQMFKIASKLSNGFPFIRVDLYEYGNHIYFGELTLYPQGGFDTNLLPETDKYLGDLIRLPIK